MESGALAAGRLKANPVPRAGTGEIAQKHADFDPLRL
jgi:hypothetical protein